MLRAAEFRVTTPVPRHIWREVLDESPEAVVEQTPSWLECMCSVGGYEDASRLYEMQDGKRLILPMVRRRGWIGRLAAQHALPPAWGIGGPLSAERLRIEDAAAIFADLSHQTPVITTLRPNPLDGEIWAAAQPRGVTVIPRLAHALNLEGGFAQVWEKRFTGQARTQVRQAERAGLTVRRDTTGELLPVFDSLMEKSLDRWAGQQHEPRWLAHWRRQRRDPLHKLQAIARSLDSAFCLWVAWHGERPAAAIVVLQGANAHYTRGVMDKEVAGPTHANYLLHKLAIEEACRLGSRRYHMGESGASAPLAQFKGRFGARAYSYAEYHFERLPIMRADAFARSVVKRLIGFKDAPS